MFAFETVVVDRSGSILRPAVNHIQEVQRFRLAYKDDLSAS